MEPIELETIDRPRTAIMMSIAGPGTAFAHSFLPNDGVGLARLEFIISSHIREHPMALLEPGRVTDRAQREEILGAGHENASDSIVADTVTLIRILRFTRRSQKAVARTTHIRMSSTTYTSIGPETPAARAGCGITVFAFALGFAHEEEFAILALCAGAGACRSVMAVYAVAVAASILVLTLASIATFNRLEHRLDRWVDRLPRISAIVLGGMSLLYLFGLV